MFQQGDVNIYQIDQLPDGAVQRSSTVVREGEVTGHAHRIVGGEVEMFELGDRIFARILSGDCSIVHEEHGAIPLGEGLYEFGPTHEYDHFAEESRELAD
jgi:hypothetical protein